MEALNETPFEGSQAINFGFEPSPLKRSSSSKNMYEDEVKNSLFRGETPDTVLTVEEIQPHIAIFCQFCSEYIPAIRIKHHRNFHLALAFLGFPKTSICPSLSEIATKRRVCIKRASKKLDEVQMRAFVKSVDYSFEKIRHYLDEEDSSSRIPIALFHEIMNVRSEAIHSHVKHIISLGVAIAPNSLHQKAMEDRIICHDAFGGDCNKCYLSVLDGHEGESSVNLVTERLHRGILQGLKLVDESNVCECLRNQAARIFSDDKNRSHHNANARLAMQYCDHVTLLSNDGSVSSIDNEEYGRTWKSLFSSLNENIEAELKMHTEPLTRTRYSGCCYASALLRPVACEIETSGKSKTQWSLHMANCGPVQAMLLGENDTYKILTEDHSTTNKQEQSRLLKQETCLYDKSPHSIVNGKPLVEGVTSITRCLGSHGDPDVKRALICEPYTCSIHISKKHYGLVMASSGLWDALSPEEVNLLVRTHMPCNYIRPDSAQSIASLLKDNTVTHMRTTSPTRNHHAAQDAAKELVQAALFAGSEENISVIVAFLPPAYL